MSDYSHDLGRIAELLLEPTQDAFREIVSLVRGHVARPETREALNELVEKMGAPPAEPAPDPQPEPASPAVSA